MKRNAIARIIIYSIVIILLLGLLSAGMGTSIYTAKLDFDRSDYIQGGSSVPASEVKNLEIEWASGNILIETADTDTISFQELSDSDDHPMVYHTKGNTLVIKYMQPQAIFGFFSVASKDLTVTVPKDWVCGELSIDAASADVTVNFLTVGEADLDMASGDCEFNGTSINELSLDSASGEIRYNGILTAMECDTASGKVTAIFDNVPRSIDFDGASADLDLTLPADAGFSVNMDSLSGNFSSDFDTQRQGNAIVCGDRACQIEVDGASGNVTIRKRK